MISLEFLISFIIFQKNFHYDLRPFRIIKMTGPNFASCFVFDQSPKWASIEKYMTEHVIPTAPIDAEKMSCQKPDVFFSNYFQLNNLEHVASRK